ncbi:dromaiocalcin-1 isoform X2 [Antennarius striatus]|uniref:dromaiocalcin-1 isoform X2 n=1 Tax=Antennarius striatus TaxID=241820 RepID=UPI0035B31B85
MYIKFCRRYAWDKKDEICENLSPQSKLSVELEGEKERKTEGKTRLYRVACIFLTILCLLLLATIIILSVLLTQTGSTVCPGKGEDGATSQLPRTCSLEECQANFVTSVPQYWRCTDCPEGWLKLDQWCFLLSTFRLSWDESRRNCSSKGASLAVISSKTVQDFLSDNGAVKYWIGLRRIGDTWTWTDNALLKQSYWADDASDKDCVVLSSTDSPGKNWIKKSCQAYTYFICQLHL